MLERIKTILGDITKQKCDAVVNAANNSLLGGGGVDGAIHRAAGSKLLDECKKLKGCETGEAITTKGYDLPAKYVIHTVGPIWHGGAQNEKDSLRKCYISVFREAKKRNIKTIAFPSISTGAYRFPVEQAVPIAVKAVIDELKQNKEITNVFFVCYDNITYNAYQTEIKNRGTE